MSFYNSCGTGGIDNTAPVLPGDSLYLIDRLLPVSVNLQCQ